jgi:glycosyltransferase involved in cell wall biosynthesis
MAGPLVTVVLTCFDHEPFVDQALDAVRAQTHRPIQLIVTDDASTDASADRIQAWLDDRWPEAAFIRHEVNRGLCRTLHEAMALVEGELVAIASADDWMEPDRLALQVAAFTGAAPEVGLVHAGVRFVDLDGNELALANAEPAAGLSGWIFPQQLAMPRVLTPSVMVRRAVYDEVGPFNEDDVVEDYDMWLRICRDHHVLHLPEVVANFRWHHGNTTTRIYGPVYDGYVEAVLRRHLGFSDATDRVIRRQLGELQSSASAGDEDALAGEGTDADVAPVDLHGGGAVG